LIGRFAASLRFGKPESGTPCTEPKIGDNAVPRLDAVMPDGTIYADDWRVPSKNGLNVLFNNRAAIGGFDISGTVTVGWY
jgi:hypothetical protein